MNKTAHHRPTAASLLEIFTRLPLSERRRFLRLLKDRGVLARQPRSEYFAARNARIRHLHQRGLSAGQIAALFDMNREAVLKLLQRSRQRQESADVSQMSTYQLGKRRNNRGRGETRHA